MPEEQTAETTAQLAIDLPVALGRLRSRLREEAGDASNGITLSQLTMLNRLKERGPMTAAQLAAAEHVSKQAIAQRLALMDAAGLIESRRDERDGRKVIVSIASGGVELLRRLTQSRSAWLVRAIEAGFEPSELPQLRAAIELLERLAAIELNPDIEIR